MDSDFWTSRLASAKSQYAFQQHQSSRLDRLGIYDFVVEDEARPDYSSTYEDVDIATLCSNLQDEHSCESRGTIFCNNEWPEEYVCVMAKVCPICSVKVARDMLSHITLQHGHLFKLQRRRRLRRVAVPRSQALSLLGRDLHEAHLQVLLGSGSGSGSSGEYRSNSVNTSSAAATDPFLSSLIFNVPTSEREDNSKSVLTASEESYPKNPAPSHIWKSSFDASLSNEERERRMRLAAGISGFVQDLFLSTLLGE